MAFENYVGRVGGLAIALGIGAAVATGWSCPAWADSTDGSVNAPAADTQNSKTADTSQKETADQGNADSGAAASADPADPGGSAGKLTETVWVQDPTDKNAFDLVERLGLIVAVLLGYVPLSF